MTKRHKKKQWTHPNHTGELTLVPETCKLGACGVSPEQATTTGWIVTAGRNATGLKAAGSCSLWTTEELLWGESGNVWFEVRKRKSMKAEYPSRNIKRNLNINEDTHKYAKKTRKTYAWS